MACHGIHVRTRSKLTALLKGRRARGQTFHTYYSRYRLQSFSSDLTAGLQVPCRVGGGPESSGPQLNSIGSLASTLPNTMSAQMANDFVIIRVHYWFHSLYCNMYLNIEPSQDMTAVSNACLLCTAGCCLICLPSAWMQAHSMQNTRSSVCI